MNQVYREEINSILTEPYQWGKIRNKTVLLTGASGAIGQVIVDVIMKLNRELNYCCHMIAVSRNLEKAKKIFSDYWEDNYFTYISYDITEKFHIKQKVDYIIHAASNTHPLLYAKDPIGTITANTLGTFQLLKLAVQNNAEFIFLSSVEIYGENITGEGKFRENDMGYINCATLRAGYPESKRVAESLCFAFAQQEGILFKIVRLARVYGGTISREDSRAIAQFLHNGLNRENIVLKSEGKQLYSYVYVMDCVSGIFAVMLNGKNSEVYNIAGTDSTITLYELAQLIAKEFGVSVVRDLPDKTEAAGFSKATCAVLDNHKLISLGWEEKTSIKTGIHKVKEQLEDSYF